MYVRHSPGFRLTHGNFEPLIVADLQPKPIHSHNHSRTMPAARQPSATAILSRDACRNLQNALQVRSELVAIGVEPQIKRNLLEPFLPIAGPVPQERF